MPTGARSDEFAASFFDYLLIVLPLLMVEVGRRKLENITWPLMFVSLVDGAVVLAASDDIAAARVADVAPHHGPEPHERAPAISAEDSAPSLKRKRRLSLLPVSMLRDSK